MEELKDFAELEAQQRLLLMQNAIKQTKSGKARRLDNERRAYYETDNPDIANRRKVYAAQSDPSLVDGIKAIAKENRFAANEKVASSFYKDITDQKVQYLAGEGADVNPVDDADADAVNAVFEPIKRQIRRQGQACLTDALVYAKGYTYLQVIGGQFRLTSVPHREIVPLYDSTGQLVNVIRVYQRGGIEFAEYHTPEKIYTYEKAKDGRNASDWKYTGERSQIETVRVYGDGSIEPVGGKGWSRLPWFELCHNNDGTSSLTNAVKTMIRCYDIVMSDFANNLIDMQDVFIKLKEGYGSGAEYGETLELMRIFKAAEDVEDVQTIEVPYMARETLLTRLQTGIYKALRGVDLERIAGGTTQTATAIRALYSDIDLWADQAEWHLEDWVLDIMETVAAYLGVALPSINITFTRRVIFNEVEQMDAISRQKGIISDKTLFENHPLVDDAQVELERIAAEEMDAAYSGDL